MTTNSMPLTDEFGKLQDPYLPAHLQSDSLTFAPDADPVDLFESALVSAWTPLSIPGVTVWLDADQLGLADGRSLDSWPDLSGLGHHGSVVSSPAPVLRANALNGLPVVRFKANEGRLRGVGMCADGSYDLTVMLVGRMVGPGVGRLFTNTYPPYNFLVGTHTSGEPVMYDAGWVGNTPPWVTAQLPYPFKLYEAVCAGGSPPQSVFSVDGVFQGSHGNSLGHSTQWNISGYDATGDQETCDCEVAELIIWDRALSGPERIDVETELRAKWMP